MDSLVSRVDYTAVESTLFICSKFESSTIQDKYTVCKQVHYVLYYVHYLCTVTVVSNSSITLKVSNYECLFTHEIIEESQNVFTVRDFISSLLCVFLVC